MDAEEKRRLRTLARNLCAALAAHRMRVSFRWALERWVPEEVDDAWYWLAESTRAGGDCQTGGTLPR